MSSNMEAEMARFEEEIASGSEPPNQHRRDFNPPPPPPMMPPPMFLPHSLRGSGSKQNDNGGNNNSDIKNQDNFPNSRDPTNIPSRPELGRGQNQTPHENHGGPKPAIAGPPMGVGPMGSPGPRGPGPMGLGPGPMGPGPMRPSGPMGPMDGGMIGPMPPPMPGFFPPPVLPDFSDMMRNRPSVYSSAPVLKKRVIVTKVEAPAKKESKKKTKDESGKESKLEVTSSNASVRVAPSGPQAGPIIPPVLPPVLQPPPFGGPPPMYGMSSMGASSQMNKSNSKISDQKRKKIIRTAAGQKWEDKSLQEWDSNDYRIFCGDLGNEVTDDTLARIFSRYNSFQRARVVRERNSKKSKGYGFVSFKDPADFIRAMREINGKYVGNRPIKLRKSNWKDRNIDVVRKKVKEKKKLGYKV